MHRMQVYIPDDLLSELRLMARDEGVSVAEILRKSGRAYTASLPKSTKKDPYRGLFEMRGIVKGETNMSTTVDEIYDEQND